MPKSAKTKSRPAKSQGRSTAKQRNGGTSRHKARGAAQRGGGTRRGKSTKGSSNRAAKRSKDVGRRGRENGGGVDAFGESNIRGEP